jgi:hypothetical protein
MSNGLRDNYGAEIGMLVTCRRCGIQTFQRQTGYNNVDAAIANRHSFLEQFEPMPDGWKIRHEADGWLCPQCNKSFDSVIQEYMTSIQKFMARGEDNA